MPASEGIPRVELEARAAGAAVASPPGRAGQPELAAAEAARLLEDDSFRARRAAEGLAAAQAQSFSSLADTVIATYTDITPAGARPPARSPLETREWILADLHMHTTWSHDCSIDVDELIDHAEAEGLGAIAVTDHNVLGGALEAVERARGRKLIVIPGEEVKTASQGEVIGLFLKEEIPKGMSFAETVEAIRAQGGLVYLPHPFDRLHAIPDPATLHRHLAEIDVFEVYNARLLFEGYNDEAFASRASTTSPQARDRTRTSSRASAPGSFACTGSTGRRSSCSRCEAPRFCAARSRSPTSRGSSGSPRPRNGSAEGEPALRLK